MFKPKTAIIWGMLIFGTAFSAADQTQILRKEGKYWVGDIQQTFKVGKTGSLTVEHVKGEVSIKAWAKDEVFVHEIRKMDIYTKSEAEAAMQEAKSSYSREGDAVRIDGFDSDREWIQSEFDIFIPAAFACTIRTQGGEISVEGTEGTVSVSTGGGDISLKNLGGIVTAKTGGGEILIENVRNKVSVSSGGGDVKILGAKGQVDVKTGGGEVNVENSDGDVGVTTGGGEIDIRNVKGNFKATTGGGSVHAVNLGGSVTATTGGGDVDLTGTQGSVTATTGGGNMDLRGVKGSITATTGGGDVTAEVTLTDFTRKHDVTIRTGGGDIRLTIPEKMPATVSAKIKTRKRNWEEYTISSDFPLQIKTEDVSSGYRVITAKGDINGGGDPIDLESGGGNIRILKLRK
jgi:hypothetical protein